MKTKEFTYEFTVLIKNEFALREEFRKKRKELEDMVQKIQNHIGKCNQFWEKHLEADVEKFVVVMKNNKSYEIRRPDKEKCRVESFLPFGINYQNASVINCTQL